MGIKNLRLKLVLFLFVVMVISSICACLIIVTIIPLKLDTLSKFIFSIDNIIIEKIKIIINLYNFLIVFFSITFALIIVTITGEKILRPIRELNKATKKVSQGDFSIELPIVGNKEDEFNILIDSFNKMTKELANMSMLHKDFISNVSHEFKTPISSIQGFATVLLNSELTEEQKEYAQIITDEATRLSKLTTNILKLTKLENQIIITDKQYFYLDEQIRYVILLLQNEWSKKSISFNIELSKINYFGNQELLQQVWLNLIGNAIKFSNINGEITIKCYIDNKNIIVIILDNGIGMNEQTINHIFDKFYQGDKSHSSEGNGLGLPLAKRIIELCDGNIKVNSTIEKGSKFIIKLPLEDKNDT